MNFSTPKTIKNISQNNGNTTITTPLYIPDGTVAAPSLTFTDDINTGLYSLGADNLGISVGGSNKMDIDTTDINVHEGMLIDYQGGSTQVGFRRSDGNLLATIEVNAGNDFVFTNGTGGSDFLIKGNSAGGNDFSIEFLDLFLVDGGIDATTAITLKKDLFLTTGIMDATTDFNLNKPVNIDSHLLIQNIDGTTLTGITTGLADDIELVPNTGKTLHLVSTQPGRNIVMRSNSQTANQGPLLQLYGSDGTDYDLGISFDLDTDGAAVQGVVLARQDNDDETTPAFAFLNDTDTGICRLGSDNIGISCGADTIMDIKTTGWSSDVQPRFLVRNNNTTQSLSESSTTDLTFWSTPVQNVGFTSFSSSVLTIATDGIYQLSFSCRYLTTASNDAGFITITLEISDEGSNPNEVASSHALNTITTNSNFATGSGVWELEAGNTIKMTAFQANAGSAQSINVGGSNEFTWWSVVKLF